MTIETVGLGKLFPLFYSCRDGGDSMNNPVDKLAGRRAGLMGRDYIMVSAVLLPVVEDTGGPALLFEVRSRQLDRQPGEICFPGGRVEEHEMANPAVAAVRETSEELGLAASDIEVVAPLDVLLTPFGTVIYPYAGRVLAPEKIEPNREEVERVFQVPISFLLDYRPRSSTVKVATRYGDDFPRHRVPEYYRGRGWQKRWSYPTYIYEYGEYFIWGMTAIMLYHFIELLKS